MSESKRPTLKLKVKTGSQATTVPPVTTPSTGIPKITLKFGGQKPSLPPAAGPPASERKAPKAKKPKKEKPSRLNQTTPKKRDSSTLNDSLDLTEKFTATTDSPYPPVKKLKLISSAHTPKTPFLRLKPKGKPPPRPLGVGYDSESSDREIDPAIEEEFILRMEPGSDCDYLRQAVTEKRFGPRSDGGADVRLKFLQRDGRRAVVTIKGRNYAACLADLPCIIEGMKSWDKRGWWKSADICQMLLVLGKIEKEDEALTYPITGKDVDTKTWQHAHGLTPPMRFVRKRRFRKRVSNRTIEAVEEEVERLLQADSECIGESKYEVLDLDRLTREASARDSDGDNGYNMLGNAGMYEGGEQDGEGEIDDQGEYFNGQAANDDMDDGLEADLEAAMMQDDAITLQITESPTAIPAILEPASDQSGLNTPTAVTPAPALDSGDESSDADDSAEEIDEDALEQQQDLLRQREEIADLEAAIEGQNAELTRQQNPILRQKLLKKIASLKADLDVKKTAIGEGDDDA